MLAEKIIARGSEECAKRERDDDRIVELAGDRDEIGDQIKRRREVCRHAHEHGLVSPGDAGIPREPSEQDGAVGEEARDCLGVLAAPCEHECEDAECEDAECVEACNCSDGDGDGGSIHRGQAYRQT